MTTDKLYTGKEQRKYMLHPGFVTSKNDTDEHYVSARDLIRLYKLTPNQCVICPHCHRGGRDIQGCQSYNKKYEHLSPRYHGDYNL